MLDSHWLMDLIRMPCKSTEGDKIILIAIDLDSRDVFAKTIKNKKQGISIAEALEEIFETTQRVPNYISVRRDTILEDSIPEDIILKPISKQEKRIIKEVVENIKNKFWEHFSSSRKQIWDRELVDSVIEVLNP